MDNYFPKEYSMEIVDLTPEYEGSYFSCLEEWSPEMQEAGDHKENWYRRMKPRGLRVKLAIDGTTPAGMIQYTPIGNALIEGENLYYTYCIWVHGHKEGQGNYQKRGIGTALLRAAEGDVKQLGGNGLVVWGLSIPVFMRASWFRKQGYTKVDRMGPMELLWKPFSDDAVPPRFIHNRRTPESVTDRAVVTCLISGWCPAANIVFERARRAAEELGPGVEYRTVDTTDRSVALEWGDTDAVFVDQKRVSTGPPASYKKVRKTIEKRLKRIGSAG